jgi:hypothetical protein
MYLPEKIDLSAFRDKQEFLIKTAKQIEKDFLSVGHCLKFSENKISYSILHELVYPIIENLLNTNPKKLQQLIYRIDLPEKVFSDTLQNSLDPASELTQLIIQRELLKVVIRYHYNNK